MENTTNPIKAAIGGSSLPENQMNVTSSVYYDAVRRSRYAANSYERGHDTLLRNRGFSALQAKPEEKN